MTFSVHVGDGAELGQRLQVLRLGLIAGAGRQAAYLPRRSGGAMNSALLPSRMSVPRPAMLVAIVTAFAAAGLGDDRRLTGVVLSVEHGVRDALGPEHGAEHFALSTLTVPTSTGCERLIAVGDLPMTARNFSRCFAVEKRGRGSPAHHRQVWRDDDDVETVDPCGTLPPGVGGAGHAGELAGTGGTVLERIVASVCVSSSIWTFFGPIAWCRPSDHRRPGIKARELIDDHDLPSSVTIVHVALGTASARSACWAWWLYSMFCGS